MSGGVDSSVAAALLAEEGHEVTGVTLRLWGGESDSGCCSVSDVDDARRVADHLGLDHHVFNFGPDFERHVVEPYVARPPRRPHAEPVHRVQPAPEVRPAAAAGRPARLRRGRHRAPRPHRRAGAGPAPGRPRRRSGQGPVLRPAHARPGHAGPHPVPDRRAHEGRGAGDGRRARAAHRGQARQPGRVLHHLGRGPGRLPRAADRRSPPAWCVDAAGVEVGRVPAVELVTVGQRRGPRPARGRPAAARAAGRARRRRRVTVGSGRGAARRPAGRRAGELGRRPGPRRRCSCSAARTVVPSRPSSSAGAGRDGDASRGGRRAGGWRPARRSCSTTATRWSAADRRGRPRRSAGQPRVMRRRRRPRPAPRPDGWA